MTISSDLRFPWDELAIVPTDDTGEIKRAYARRLRTIDAATDVSAFQVLRSAYEAALTMRAARHNQTNVIKLHEPEILRSDQVSAPATASPAIEPLLAAVERLALADKVTEAITEIECFLGASAISPNYSTHLQARLLCLVLDDPRIPAAMLGGLARRFHWGEVGNALEAFRPDLQERFLYRLTAAHEWLDRVKAIALGQDREGELARFVLASFSETDDLSLLSGFNRADVCSVLNDARRYGPLLGGLVDPRRIKLLNEVYNGAVRVRDKERPARSSWPPAKPATTLTYIKRWLEFFCFGRTAPGRSTGKDPHASRLPENST
jgi:hypothetical protein